MESQVLSNDVERECRRVAAAFEATEWKRRNLNKEYEFRFDAVRAQFLVNWWIGYAPLLPVRLIGVEVTVQRGQEGNATWLGTNEVNLHYEIREVGLSTREHMARGLYRLGIEEEGVLAKLNHPLSTHEKMELRLSMPREFWPEKWLDEEEGNSSGS